MTDYAELFEGKTAEEINKIIAEAQNKKAELRKESLESLETKVKELLGENDLSIKDLLFCFEEEVREFAIHELNIGTSTKRASKASSSKPVEPPENKEWQVLEIGGKDYLISAKARRVSSDILEAIQKAGGNETKTNDIFATYSVGTPITGEKYLKKVAELEAKKKEE